MKTFTKILRFRFDAEIFEALKKIPRMSEYVRQAIREKLEKDKLIKKQKLPF